MKNEKKLEILRHSTSHLMALSVMKLFPKVKFAIGPAIENGFYYDLAIDNLSQNDLLRIEKEMEKLKKQNLKFEKKEMDIDKALSFFKEKKQPFKVELLEDLKREGEKKVSLYTLSDFVDLCKGPHLENTSQIGSFKLLSVAGAYWRGSEKNKMLTRIYGTCFEKKEELDNYLSLLEKAKESDHRKIGRELDLFSIDESIGPGLILWHPKLSIVREEIESYWRKQHRKRGYQYLYTPHIGLSNLWETSGHLSFFKENMYPEMALVEGEKEKSSYYVKPMNCPFHIQIYNSSPKSYRDLPLRWCELGTVYRYEESGVLHGMLRVRGLTQDDAHLIVREDQLVDELNEVLDFAFCLNRDFGFKKLNVYLSLRSKEKSEKYVGSEKIWNMAEKTLKEVLKNNKINYKEDIGGAKFYGPSIDLKAVDSMGREWQGTTIQLDFNLPKRFKMTFINDKNKEEEPIMIHRTLLGSMERFVATLIEEYQGAFPVWLAPTQIALIPITEKQNSFAKEILKILQENDLRVNIDSRSETLSYKIRDAQKEKIPYMIILGEKEKETGLISLRKRGKEKTEQMSLNEFLKIIKENIAKKSNVC
jgi:threonyl-tRNA synthetase